MIVLVVWGDAVLMIFNHRGSSTVPDRQTHSDHPFQPLVFLSIASWCHWKLFLFKLDNFLSVLRYQHLARLHHLCVHTRVSSVWFFYPVSSLNSVSSAWCLAQTWEIGVSSAFALQNCPHIQGASVNCVFFTGLASVNKTSLINTTQLLILIVLRIVSISAFSLYSPIAPRIGLVLKNYICAVLATLVIAVGGNCMHTNYCTYYTFAYITLRTCDTFLSKIYR